MTERVGYVVIEYNQWENYVNRGRPTLIHKGRKP